MATMFDPKKPPAGGGNQDHGVPPGDYVIALTWFERKLSKKSQQPYLRAKYTVVCGAAKGKTFWASISLDTSSAGAMTRLSLMAEQCGVTEAFDLDSDDAVRANLALRPFKARVRRVTENGYTNNDIERYIKDGMSAAEEKAARTWVLDYEEGAEYDGDGGSPGTGKSKADDFGDDDIPF